MPTKIIYKEGDKVGNLIFIKELNKHYHKSGQARRILLCKCPYCNNEFSIMSNKARKGQLSCGCFLIKRHNELEHKLYNIRIGLIERCYNINNDSYKDYGGRGIKVCDRWLEKVENFYIDMIDKYKEGLQIDRINNNDNYTPENCRWVTPKQNCRNRRNNTLLTFEGKTKTLIEWSEETGINRDTIGHRLKRGWTIKQALTEKVKKNKYA